MRPNVLCIALLTLGLAACSSNGAAGPADDASEIEQGFAAGNLQISVGKKAYSRSDLDLTNGAGVRATLVSSADRTFYSRLGDAFNAAAEQDPLYVSNGSDASLERQDGSTWVGVAGPQMVEGVKIIELRPGTSYELIAHASAAIPAGSYRIVVAYRNASDGSVTARATSTPFDIR